MNFSVLALLGALLPWSAWAEDAGSVVVDFNTALAMAEHNAPTVAAAEARAAAARYAAVAAGELPDPKLVMGLDNLPVSGADDWSLSRDSMTMQRVGVSQALPNGGKRKAQVAQAEAAIADAEFGTRIALLALKRDTALAWLNSYYSAARRKLQAELVVENSLLEKTVAARYAARAAASTELLLARREALALADSEDDLQSAQASADAELRRVLGAPVRADADAVPPSFAIDVDHLRAHLSLHPDLRIYDAKVAGANAALREAEAAKRPDWNVELAYQHRGPRYGEMVSAELTVDLPLFSARRQDPLIAARAAEVAALDDERNAMLRAHEAELEAALADYQRLDRQSARMREQRLPLLEQSRALAYQAYAAGSGSLADLLEARRLVASTRFDALNLEAARSRAAAQLHFRFEGDDHE